MVSLKNIKTNQLRMKWDNNQDGLQSVLTIYKRVVIIDLLDHICVNKSFYILNNILSNFIYSINLLKL